MSLLEIIGIAVLVLWLVVVLALPIGLFFDGYTSE